MNLQKMIEGNQGQRVGELLRIIQQKDEFIQSLLQQLSKKEKHMITVLSSFQNKARSIPFQIYQRFLYNPSLLNPFILLKIDQASIKGRAPIWFSQNLQLNLWQESLFKSSIDVKIQQKENEFKCTLANNVNQLKQNLQKCENIILSLKEIKQNLRQKQKMLRKQQQPIRNQQLEQKLKQYIEKLQVEIFKRQKQIKQLKCDKTELINKISELQNRQKEQCFRIQNLIIAKNEILNSRQETSDPTAKRRHKKILVNY